MHMPQDLQGLELEELADDDLLEAALERGIARDPALYSSIGGGADQPEVAARERGLEHVRGVHRRAAGGALPDQIVQLVDEQEDVSRRCRFRHELAEPRFKLTAVGGPGEKADGVERQEPDIPQRERHAVGGDAFREAFGDRRFADARGTDQRRIVLAVAEQDVDGARNSCSRQRTGSRRPARASAVRSRVNRARAPPAFRFWTLRLFHAGVTTA